MRLLKQRKFMMFREEEGGGGGGGLPSVSSLVGGGEPETATTEVTTPEVKTEVAPAAPTTVSLDPKQFAEAVKAAGLVPAPAPVTTTRREPTPEERAAALKELGIWEPDDNFFVQFNNMDTQKQAIQSMVQGIYAHLYKVMNAGLTAHGEQFNQQLTPFQQYLQEQQQQQQQKSWDTEFAKDYEPLAKPELTPLRNTAVQQLLSEGQKFPTSQAAHKAVADRMVTIIRAIPGNENFTLPKSSGGSTPSKANPNAIKPAPKSGAGGGGSNGTGTVDPSLPRAVQSMRPVVIPA